MILIKLMIEEMMILKKDLLKEINTILDKTDKTS